MTRNFVEWDYLAVLKKLLYFAKPRNGRNGEVRSLFDQTIKLDLAHGFPLLTTKKMHWRSITTELCWILQGRTDLKYLRDRGVTIWDEWDPGNGQLGPVYGAQMRNFGGGIAWDGLSEIRGVDQLKALIEGLCADPYGRRHLITLWNPADLTMMALPPCHGIAIQFYVDSDERLNCAMHQRSADWFLGVPFNIASYAIMLHLVAREVGRKPGKLHLRFVDAHLYANHLDAATTQIERQPLALPELYIHGNAASIFEIEPEQMQVQDYESYPAIKAEVSK